MMQQQDRQEPPNWRTYANVLMLVLLAMSCSLEVFFRRRFGSRYFSFQALVAFLGIPFWTVFWPGEDARPLLIFWGLFVLMMFRARVESVAVARRGEEFHSRFNGDSVLARFFKRSPEWMIKGGYEPALAWTIGALLMPVSQSLGSYLLFAGFAMGTCASIGRSVGRARAQDMQDALTEQQLRMERFHELRARNR